MTLSIGLDAALSGLSTTAEQTAVVSRNVARAGDPNATRKTANVISLPGAGVRVASITRNANASLLEKVLGATSDSSTQKAILDALNSLNDTINDPELDASPAALIAKLTDAIQRYAEAPQDPAAARSAVAAAGDLARGLNSATQAVQQVRAGADAAMADGVNQLNTLLGRFETLNRQIVAGSRRGADVTDLLDQRDEILRGISEQVGIRTVSRADNDMAIYTDSGITLFDVRPRSVTFDRTQTYTAGTTGNAVYIDGVPITGSSGPMLARSGRLVGLASIRDNAAVAYQSQLDEVARGLITAFAESDQSATPTLPDAPGLFTYAGAPAMPASGTVLPGLAASIRVAASVDPAQGGNAGLLRDGGIAGNAAYVYNTTGAAAYTDRLQSLLDGLSATQAFDPSAQVGPSASVTAYATGSAAWLQEARKSASDRNDYQDTLLQRSTEALSKDTGINLDEEMTSMLELERSYQASTRLITTIDSMLDTLLQAVR
jgi:flagellar hook-associated protein 1